MDAALKLARMVHAAMLIALILYVFLGEWVPHPPRTPSSVLFYVVTVLAIAMIGVMFVMRRANVVPAEQTLSAEPGNSAALQRWRLGQMVTLALCESLGLYGLVLRFLGFTLSQVLPFYVVSLVLLLYFRPRLPVR